MATAGQTAGSPNTPFGVKVYYKPSFYSWGMIAFIITCVGYRQSSLPQAGCPPPVCRGDGAERSGCG